MKLSHLVAWASIGALSGLAIGSRIVAGLEPITDRYSVLRNGVALGDASLVLGFPVAFAVWPLVTVDSSMSNAVYQHQGIVGSTLAITLNWAMWSVLVGALIERVVLRRWRSESAARPSP